MTPTPLWKHQADDLAASRDLPGAAVTWEPRLGKSRLVVETARYLAEAGKINAVLLVAPNGVHLNWTREELPLYWQRTSADPGAPVVLEWDSGRAGTVKMSRNLDLALSHSGVVWLAVNVEAVATPRLSAYLDKFVRRRRVLLVVDESHAVKNPRAKRTRAVHRIAERCPYRRVLTGTPVSQGPFDLWAQYHVLDPAILGPRFTTFKYRYGVFRRMRYGSGPSFDELVEYRNLDELRRRIAPTTFHRLKRDCLDLPPRMMRQLPDGTQSDVLGIPRRFALPGEHARVYRELRDNLVARLDGGEEVTAAQALTNLLRLQQVSRGHVTLEDGSVRDLGEPYPAAEETAELVAGHPGKSIVWCRFTRDVDLLEKVFTRCGIGGIRCDGRTPMDERPGLRVRFREDPAARVWYGTIGTGGVGVDLPSASLMVFYSHGFDLVQRLQALERNYGSNQRAERLEVVDLVAADTADEKALAVLERKDNLAARMSGRQLREVIT